MSYRDDTANPVIARAAAGRGARAHRWALKIRSSIIAACFFVVPVTACETAQTVADIYKIIRQGLREGKMEIDTPVGRYIHPPCNHDMKIDDTEDPTLGPSLHNLNDESRTRVREWISEKKPKWVAIIAPADTPARNFVDLCALLRADGVGYTTFLANDVEGRKFTQLTIIKGNFTELKFSKKKFRSPMHLPIAPNAQQGGGGQDNGG